MKLIAKKRIIIHLKNLVIMKRKELLPPIREKSLSIRGKIRLLGFFRKQQSMRKQPLTNKKSQQLS
jgi:hypothetical protein